jgi:hypothetical protein
MTVVLKEVEAATWLYEWNDVSLAFPVPGMMMKHWESGAMPGHLIEAGDCYKRAMEAARRALERSRPAGRGYVERWIGRLEFGIGYLATIAALREAATAAGQQDSAQALRKVRTALRLAENAIRVQAEVGRDQSDRGTIAVLNEYVVRPLRAKAAELAKPAALPQKKAATVSGIAGR